MNRTCVSLAWVFVPALFIISGCPNTNTAENWPSQRLDNNPSTQPSGVGVADIDGDGRKDVVSVWRGSTVSGARTGVVAVHFQDADQFTTVVVNSNTRYANVNGMRIADIDQDGRPDVLVANNDRITYLRAAADPRVPDNWQAFDIAASQRSDWKAWFDVGAAQIDGQAGLDIFATLNDVGRLVWFASPADPNSADGWTIHTIDSTTRAEADSLLPIDMNGDGLIDVVCSAPGDTNGVISWYEHPADPVNGTWTKHVMTKFGGATRFAMGDVDGNGTVDLVAISPEKSQAAWFPRPDNVAGAWDGWINVDYTKISSDQRVPIDVALADMNGDGVLDVVIATASPAGLFWYTPGSQTGARWNENRIAALSSVSFAFFAADDLDNSGLPDAIVPIINTSDNTQDRVTWFQNPG